MSTIPFTKMHGAGNDFIVLDATNGKLEDLDLNPEWIQRLSHRNFGIGFDQLLIIEDSDKADFKYRIFNADGGEVEMCGNGVRCFAKYVKENGLSDKNEIEVETMVGIIKPVIDGDLVRVDMGSPILVRSQIPVALDSNTIKSEDREFEFEPVSMGNPHAVIFLEENLTDFPVEFYGKPIENNLDYFPKRINVEFINVVSSTEINMRVWERGTGETLACGTGACGAVVAGIVKGLLSNSQPVIVHLHGGDLVISWSGNDRDSVFMRGPAEEVFRGTI